MAGCKDREWQIPVNSRLAITDEQDRRHPGKLPRTATTGHVTEMASTADVEVSERREHPWVVP